MVKYHPDVRYLTDYSAGSLPPSQALCVAAHLHYCKQCQTRVRELNELGSTLFSELQPQAVSAGVFNSLQERIQQNSAIQAQKPATTRLAASDADAGLPRAIIGLCKGQLDNLKWRNIGSKFRFSPLSLGDRERETSLLHIRAGGAVPHHRHRGDEITVVLTGSFSDQEDRYNTGDFIVRTSGESHRPVASENEDCLCLSTLDAPIQMSNWLLRLLQPLFNTSTA